MGRVGHRLAQLRRDWSRSGAAGVWRRLSLTLRPRASELIILACHHPVLPAHRDPTLASLELRFAQDDEIDELGQQTHLTERYRSFFAAGARCLVARQGTRPIGHLWSFTGEYTITVDDYRTTRLPVALDVRSVFTGNAYVLRELRNGGVFRALKARLLEEYPVGTSFYTWVDRRNDASLAVNRALGYTPVATLRFGGSTAQPTLSLRTAGATTWTEHGPPPWPPLRLEGDSIFGYP